MQKRKSHTKSRNGCQSCKKRHVKCDEQGPPCLNCILRKEAGACVFPLLRNAAIRAGSANEPTLAPVPSLMSPSPCSFSSATGGSRLLELELMHRWSTRSWTCQASTPECRPYLLDHLPRAALRHSYLLNAILATAAVDLALSCVNMAPAESGTYFRAALEYGTKAITDFRAQVTSLDPENIDLVFYFSTLVGVANFAMPTDKSTSIIDRVCDYTHIALKSSRIAFENIEWLITSPSPVAVIIRDFSMNLDFLDVLDSETRVALALLSSVSRQVRIPATSPAIQASAVVTGEAPSLDEGQLVGQGPFAAGVYIYQLAINQTKYCFAEDLQDRLKGYFQTVFAAAGVHFTNAVRDREPMAMFIFMYWGVLVHRATRDPALWILASEGQDVVSEASEVLLRSKIVAVPGVREGIAWTRSQVGLPPLPGCSLPATLIQSGIAVGVDTPESIELWRKELEA